MQEQVISAGYSIKEEIAHSVSHGIGLLLSIAGLVTLLAYSMLYGDIWHVTSSSIYGATLIVLYGASTLYHSVTVPDIKKVLQKIDHAAIYLLIAGTSTPFTLISLRGGWGWILFVAIWGLALVGIVYKVTASNRFRLLSVLLYLVMGWLVLVAIEPMVASVARPGLWLLLAGGRPVGFEYLVCDGDLIEVQGTAEGHAFTDDEFKAMLDLARNGIAQIVDAQIEAIDAAVS
mgnify:CR=1 FL=1